MTHTSVNFHVSSLIAQEMSKWYFSSIQVFLTRFCYRTHSSVLSRFIILIWCFRSWLYWTHTNERHATFTQTTNTACYFRRAIPFFNWYCTWNIVSVINRNVHQTLLEDFVCENQRIHWDFISNSFLSIHFIMQFRQKTSSFRNAPSLSHS